MYLRADHEALALQKFGRAGLEKKRSARDKREATKRTREEACMELAALHDAKKPCADLAGASSGALAPQAFVDAGAQAPQALEGLRAEAQRALKKMCTWDFLRSKRAPNGAWTTVRLER